MLKRLWKEIMENDYGKRLWKEIMEIDYGKRSWRKIMGRDYGKRLWTCCLHPTVPTTGDMDHST